MPQTKTQGAVFGLLMSYFMALGMEVTNVAHKLGAMSNAVFLPALKETVFMGAIVFVVSMLYGSRAGQHIAHKEDLTLVPRNADSVACSTLDFDDDLIPNSQTLVCHVLTIGGR